MLAKKTSCGAFAVWSGLRPQPKMLAKKTSCGAFAVQG
jgi:hypothetical protein